MLVRDRNARSQRGTTHLADPTDVLIARLLVEPEVLVESKPDVVAVEAVRELAQVQEVLLQRAGDRRLQQQQQRIPRIACIECRVQAKPRHV